MVTTRIETSVDFQTLFQDTPTPLMVLDRHLCFMAANDCYLAMTGRTSAALIGRFVFDAFPEAEDRVAVIRAAFEQALAGETTSLERNVFAIERADGVVEDVWWDCEQRPVRAGDGAVIGVLQHAKNVSGDVAAERMREAITTEYDHRVRNLLSKVSAIARQSARSTDSLQQFIDDFDPRIMSMARAHQLLVEGSWEWVAVADLVNGELAPYRTPQPDAREGIAVAGPPVLLSSRVARALGMALHELATNAVKHGALSQAGGRLAVTWHVDQATGTLHLCWRESGMSGLEKPRAAGFGSTIIDNILPSEVGGSVNRNFTGQGLVCSITIPVPTKA
jgi:PAS domain S-box-containing protein